MYTRQVTLKEVLEEVNGMLTLEEVLKEQVFPAPNYYTEKDFITDLKEKVNSDTEYVVTKAWGRIYRYFVTNSRFQHMSIKEILNYFNTTIKDLK